MLASSGSQRAGYRALGIASASAVFVPWVGQASEAYWRGYFAAHALQELLADAARTHQTVTRLIGAGADADEESVAREVHAAAAAMATRYANDMLAARKRGAA